MITSLDNQQLKNVSQLLKKKKERDEQGLFVVEGVKMFEEALNLPSIIIEKAYISEQLFNDGYCDSLPKTINYEVVKEACINKVCDTVTPQGILALIKQPVIDINNLFTKEILKLLVLEDIQDPGNLGTMLRTTEAAGFDAIIATNETVDVFSPKVVRATMGAIFRVPFIRIKTELEAFIQSELKNSNITTYAACLDGSVNYKEITYDKKAAILIGNEGNGLKEQTKNVCDYRIHIPMQGKAESLNAAISAAILMFYLA